MDLFRKTVIGCISVLVCAWGLTSAPAAQAVNHARTQAKAHVASDGAEVLEFGRLGAIHIYRNAPQPKNVVLFISGDGGWNLGVVDMARSLADLDALVAGIDITHYLKQLETSSASCSYPPGDFEALSQYLQKKYAFRDYTLPIIVGYSSGATLVYSTLAQAPPNTFRGGLGLGFCPDLMITKMMCKGNGLEWEPGPKGKGVNFLPSSRLQTPFIAFQGEADQVCDPLSTARFVQQTRGARIVNLPKVGHGFSVPKNWLPQFKQAFQQLAAAETAARPPAQLGDLPLVELPVAGDGDYLAVMLSGDGGWASIDRELAGALTADGIPVVGWDSLHYYWTRREPDAAARDLQRIVEHYAAAWHKNKVLLIGYSRGADVLPFLVNRLSGDVRERASLVVLLGLSSTVDFEFKVSDWLPGAGEGAHDVVAEANKIRGITVSCIFGADEKDSACRRLDPKAVRVTALPGGHHFGGDYPELAHLILKDVKR